MLILCKQIPYAIGQLTVNKLCHETVHRFVSPSTRESLTPASRLTISLRSGLVAGVAAAISSQPADTLLSQINKGHGPTGSMPKRLYALAVEAGPTGLFAALGPCCVITLAAGQFLIYGAIKEMMGAPQGLEIHKKTG